MTGTILYVRHHFVAQDPSTWLSFLIRQIDGCWANHCAIVIYIDGKKYVVEARGSGVFLATWDEWLKHRPRKSFIHARLKKEFPMPADMFDRILSKTGRPYDKKGLFLFHLIKKVFNKWLGDRSEDGKMVCSEYVAWCYKEYFKNNWYWQTTGDIMRSGYFEYPEI